MSGRVNPDGFTPELRAICAEECAEFGEPPCWRLPEMVEPCELITPCETCVGLALHALLEDHAAWSADTFGPVGPLGPLRHLARECGELLDNPRDLSEWADVLFLLSDAMRRAGALPPETEAVEAVEAALALQERNQPPLVSPYLASLRQHALRMLDRPADPVAWAVAWGLFYAALRAADVPSLALLSAGRAKLSENQSRTWPPAVDGQPCEHVKGNDHG